MSDQGDITKLVNRLCAGELLSRDDLFPIVYAELRHMAAGKLREDPMARHIGVTELVQVVYLKLFGDGPAIQHAEAGTPNGHGGGASAAAPEKASVQSRRWQNRRHFFGSAARAMERILVDVYRDRQKAPARAGILAGDGMLEPDSLSDGREHAERTIDLLALSAALRELEAQDEVLAEIVRHRVFLGLTADEVANTMGITTRTVQRHWAMARAWLLRRMKSGRLD